LGDFFHPLIRSPWMSGSNTQRKICRIQKALCRSHSPPELPDGNQKSWFG
jgi:hypothetical protein